MEKENKKIRDEAARQFNDAVRFLVTFVRKRDPRYLPNTQTDSERQKSMRNAAASQAAKARAANQERIASYEPPSWAWSQEETTEEDFFPEAEDESEAEVLECIVCNKTFKSEKQLQVHEASKKHVKAVQKLRWRMRREGAELDLNVDLTVEMDEPVDEPHKKETSASGERHGIQRGDQGDHTVTERLGHQDAANDNPTSSASDDGLDDDDYAPRNAVESRLAVGHDSYGEPDVHATVDHDLLTATEQASLQDIAPRKKVGKAKAKREKRAAHNAQQIETVGPL